MVFFHHTSSDLLAEVYDDLDRISDNPMCNTMMTDDFTVVSFEDLSDFVNEQQKEDISDWNDAGVAYRFDLHYNDLNFEE